MKGFTTPAELAARGRDFVRVPGRDIARVVTLATSGSTGAPKRLYFTPGDLERTTAFFHHGMAHICAPGDRVAILMGSGSPGGLGRLLEEGLLRLGASPALYGFVDDFADAARFLAALRPATLVGLPAQLRRLALMLPGLRPKSVLLSGDYVPESLRAAVARLWAAPVFSHYGLTEGGLGFAVQCPALAGHHIRQDEFHVEIVDPATGESLPDGAWGELVFTTLRREAMPLHRYRTGDISRLVPEPCPCGYAGPRLGRVLGRWDELQKPVPIYALDELLYSLDGLLDHTARLDGDALTVTAEGGAEALSEAERRLRAAFPRLRIRICPAPVETGRGKRALEWLTP